MEIVLRIPLLLLACFFAATHGAPPTNTAKESTVHTEDSSIRDEYYQLVPEYLVVAFKPESAFSHAGSCPLRRTDGAEIKVVEMESTTPLNPKFIVISVFEDMEDKDGLDVDDPLWKSSVD